MYGDKVYTNFLGLNVEDDIECGIFIVVSINSLILYWYGKTNITCKYIWTTAFIKF